MASPSAKAPSEGALRRFRGCSRIGDYEMLQKLGEGTFGEVHKARHIRTGSIYALKKILMHNEKDGFPITALREIKLLKMLSHDNILRLEEMAVERPKGEGRMRLIMYMVTPYMDHDLSGLLDNPDVHFSVPQIKCYMFQLFKGLRYLHESNILHRDMKAANLLINNRGRLQIADFGLARHYDGPTPVRGRGNGEARREYTTLVVTRWYRPPELLLQLRRYTPAIDMWGAGCVFGEMFKRKPILAGNTDINQAEVIFQLVGSPDDKNMPGWNELPGAEPFRKFGYQPGRLNEVFRELGPQGLSLLRLLLTLDWRTRINAMDALDHPYFKTEPLPMDEKDIPRFADSHELDRRNARGQKQALPPAPAGGTVGMGPNGEWTGSGPPGANKYMNGDRSRYPPGGPPGPPPGPPGRGYDRRPDHRPPPPPPHRGAQPPWGGAGPYDGPPRHSNLPPPPGEGRHPLPRPPRYGPGERGHERDRDRDRDTYVPSYDGRPRPRGTVGDRRSGEPDDRSRDGRRGSRDSGQSRDGSDRGRTYRERERPGDSRDFGRERRDGRTRSRSPDRREPERRDRNRDRDRDVWSSRR